MFYCRRGTYCSSEISWVIRLIGSFFCGCFVLVSNEFCIKAVVDFQLFVANVKLEIFPRHFSLSKNGSKQSETRNQQYNNNNNALTLTRFSQLDMLVERKKRVVHAKDHSARRISHAIYVETNWLRSTWFMHSTHTYMVCNTTQ